MSHEAPSGPRPTSSPDDLTTVAGVLPTARREAALRRELEHVRRRLRQTAAVAVLLAAWLVWEKSSPRSPQPSDAEISAARRDIERDKDRLYADSMASATEDIVRGREAAVREVLERQRPVTGAKDRRGWEWYYADTLLNPGTSQVIVAERPLRAMALSPDEQKVAVAGDDGRITVWSADTLENLGAWEAKGGSVHGLSWNPAGLLAAALDDGGVAVWETTPPHETARWKAHDKQVTAVKWHRHEPVLISGGSDGAMSMWKPTGELLNTSQCKGPVLAMDLQPGRDSIAVILGTPQRLVIGTPGNIAEAHEVPLIADGSALAWHPAGLGLVLSMHRTPVYLLNSQTNEGAQALRTESIARATAFNWSPGGHAMATGCVNGSILLTDPWDPNDKPSKLNGHVGQVSGLTWLKRRDRLLSIGEDGTLRAWDEPRRPGEEHMMRTPCAIAAAEWSPVDDLLAVVHDGDEVQILDGTTREVLWAHALPRPTNLDLPFKKAAVAWSKDGRLVAVACPGRALTLWNATDGRKAGHIGTVMADEVSWMPDTQQMLVKVAGLWQTLTTEGPRHPLSTPPGTAWLLPFCGGRTAALQSDGEEVRLLPAGDDASSLPSLPGLKLNSHIVCTVMNPAHTKVALGGENGSVVWFDMETAQWSRPSLAHSGPVAALAWSADGARLASFGADGTCRIYHVALAVQTWMLNYHTNPEIVGAGWNARGDILMVACSSENKIETFDAGRSLDRETGRKQSPAFKFQRLANACTAIERNPGEAAEWEIFGRLLQPTLSDAPNAERDLLLAAAKLGEMALFQPPDKTPVIHAKVQQTWQGQPLPAAVQVLQCCALNQWDAALALCTQKTENDAETAWFRLAQAEALHQLGRKTEAETSWMQSWRALRSDWVSEAEQAEPASSDPVTASHPSLAPWSSVTLDSDWTGGEQNNLSALPLLLKQPGYEFATGAFIQMAGKSLRSTSQHLFPRITDWIPFGKPARRAVFLIAAACYSPQGMPREATPAGTCVGSLYLRRENGSAVRIPLIYGTNVWDWWVPSSDPVPAPPEELVAWRGSNPKAQKMNHSLALYRLEWKAGADDADVTAFSVTSTLRKPAPMVLAAEVVPAP